MAKNLAPIKQTFQIPEEDLKSFLELLSNADNPLIEYKPTHEMCQEQFIYALKEQIRVIRIKTASLLGCDDWNEAINKFIYGNHDE